MKSKTVILMITMCTVLPFFARTQTFTFTPNDLTVSGVPGDRIGCHAEVKNLLTQKQTIHIQRLRNQIPLNWMSSFCLNQCYAPFTDEADEEIPAGATMTFTMYFDTDPSADDVGEVDIRLYAKANPNESYKLTFKAITKRTTTGMPEPTPTDFALRQNFPNPFNPTTSIQFTIPKTVPVALRVYDLLGREVRTLTTGMRQVGVHSVQWDSKDNNGQMVHSGYYLYKLQAGTFTETRKMLLLK